MSAESRLVFGKDDVLFGAIEKLQAPMEWGHVLDAGTGLHSLRWLATLKTTSLTAVTADETMQRNVQREVDALGMTDTNVVIGNWFATAPTKSLDELLSQQYDVILADYLIGAMDGFSPYQQDVMLFKLTKLLKPGGRLYVVGLEPIPDHVKGDGNVMCKIRQVRDACILLAGHRCYREYPLKWMLRQVEKESNLNLIDSETYKILYRHATMVKQINVGRSKLRYMPEALRDGMRQVLDDLEEQARVATENGRVELGWDYIVAAERKQAPEL